LKSCPLTRMTRTALSHEFVEGFGATCARGSFRPLHDAAGRYSVGDELGLGALAAARQQHHLQVDQFREVWLEAATGYQVGQRTKSYPTNGWARSGQ
jgi:hypothetical protein